MRLSDEDFKRAKTLVEDNWPEVLLSAGFPKHALNKQHGPCPMCGGKDRYRFEDSNGIGSYYCNGCGPGDGFKLMDKVCGLSYVDATRHILEKFTGVQLDPNRPTVRVATPAKPAVVDLTPKEREKLRKYWTQAKPIAGTLAETYLQERGLSMENWPNVLRCHPSMGYYEQDEDGNPILIGNFPCMLAVLQGPDGRVTTLHRTYLDPKGHGKADVRSAKKAMSKVGQAAAIRLFEVKGDEMAIAEGIETAMAVTMQRGIACWATYSSGVMKSFVPPPGVTKVWVYADNDVPDEKGRRAGQDAAKELIARLQSEGMMARMVLPAKKGQDFADIFAARK